MSSFKEKKENKSLKGDLPSFKEFDEDYQKMIGNHEDIFCSSQNNNNKCYFKSMMKVEEEEQKGKSIKELVSGNDVGNENELFYLSH